MATIQDTDEVIFTGYPKRMWVWDIDEDYSHEDIVVCERPKNTYHYITHSGASYKYAKDIPEKTAKDLKVGDTFRFNNSEKKFNLHNKKCTVEFVSGNILIFSCNYSENSIEIMCSTVLLSELERMNVIID